MNIAIVEDDATVQAQLSSYIGRYFEQDAHRYHITCYSDGDEVLENYSAAHDLILLDIQMPRIDGLKTAEKIRELDETVYIVFITNLANYAICGYSVNALDFMLKPANYMMLKQILQRVEKLLRKRTARFITLPTDQGLVKLDVNQIDYIESEGHILTIHTERGDYRFRETIKNMESQMNEYDFYRCNNCYLVNLARLERVDHGRVTIGGIELSISRPRYKSFMDALTAYMGGVKG